jgi:hypothetical protein
MINSAEIISVVFLNIFFCYLTNWLLNTNIPKPQPHQTLIAPKLSPFESFFLFCSLSWGTYILSAGVCYGLSPLLPYININGQSITLNFIILLIIGLITLFNLSSYYILYDTEIIKGKRGPFEKEKLIYWKNIVELQMPGGVYSLKEYYSVITDQAFEKPFRYNLLIQGEREFDKTTQSALNEFHRKILAAVHSKTSSPN